MVDFIFYFTDVIPLCVEQLLIGVDVWKCDCSDASFGYPGGPLLFKNLNFGIDLDSRVASKNDSLYWWHFMLPVRCINCWVVNLDSFQAYSEFLVNNFAFSTYLLLIYLFVCSFLIIQYSTPLQGHFIDNCRLSYCLCIIMSLRFF